MKRLFGPWGGFVLAAVVLLAAYGAKPVWTRIKVAYELRVGRDALRGVNPTAALPYLESAVRAAPNRADAHYLLASANRRLGRVEAAQEHLQEARKLGWRRQDLERQQFMLTFLSGNLEQAEPHLMQLLNSNPPDDEAEEIYESLVRGYLAEYRLAKAKLCLDYWLEWRPDSIQCLAMRAQLWEGMNDRDNQAHEFKQLLQYHPDNVDARLGLAEILLFKNQVTEAQAEFEKVLEYDPQMVVASMGIGICQRRLGGLESLEEAKSRFEAAVEEDLPKALHSMAYRELGQIAMEQKQDQLAVTYLEKALELSPDASACHYSLGLALNRVGRKEEADKHMKRSDEIGQVRQKLVDLEHELAGDPTNPDLHYKKALLAFQEGDKQRAGSALLQVLKFDPNHREAHLRLAEFYEEGQRRDLAQRHREAAARIAAKPAGATDEPEVVP